MVTLTSSKDVPQVRQRQDPGLRVDPQAFQSPVATAAEEITPAIDAFHQAAVRQQNRRDTVDSAEKINALTLESDNELRRLNAEDDLSREDVLQGYGKFLSDRKNELLSTHGGSDDSMARLNVRLQDVESRAIGQASALSTRLGRERVTTTFNDSLDPLVQAAAEDPTPENVDGLMVAAETYLDDLKGAFDPSQEQALRAASKEQIALSALDSLITGGRAEAASSLLENRLFTELTPESQRSARRRIQGVRDAHDKFDREVSSIESRLGRSLTEQELLSKVGISSATQKLTEKDKRIQGLISRGYSQEFAEDIASGSIEIKGPDQFGQYTRVNSVTNESTPVAGEDTQRITEEMQAAQPEAAQPAAEATTPGAQPERLSLESAVMEGTGPFAAIRAGVSNVIGPFVEGEIFEETASAKQKVRTFNQFAKSALVNNPKFPVAEQAIVQRLLPDVEAVFLDPDRARTALGELKGSLNEMHDAKLKELTKPDITSKRRAELSDQMSRVNEIITLMTEEEAEALPEGVPEGSEPAGQSKRGNPVFRTPEGKLLEVAQ